MDSLVCQGVHTTFRIVCLGGGAGGLEAFMEILLNLPANTGMAFVIVSHRGFDTTTLQLPLIASVTKMKVVEVQQGLYLEPNCVFLAPSFMEVTTDGITLHLQARSESQGDPTSVSIFLQSLARMIGSRAVAVILSGMGCDGSDALAAVKDVGGTTLAQFNPVCESMPRNAIETGHVDFVLSPARIAKKLLVLAQPDLAGIRSSALSVNNV